MIRIKLKNVVLIAALLMVISCSSIDSDAKKAASLINKSTEQSHALKFKDAEKNYLKAQDIINKYKEKDDAAEFYKHFADYRDKDKKQNAK